jgi:diguanylate cyclase (GGDEF)-like protein/PAS domain S-box-containing protein
MSLQSLNMAESEASKAAIIAQLHTLLGNLPLGVTAFDTDLRLIFWNDHIFDLLGLPPEAVYPHARFEDMLLYPARRGEYGPGDPVALVAERTARARRFEAHRFERETGDGRTLLVEGYPIRIDEQITGFVTTYTDITERKQAEARLAQQNAILRAIIDNFPGGISLFDTDLRMRAHNRCFQELLDLPASLLNAPDVHFEDLIRFNASRDEYGPGDKETQIAAIVDRARHFQQHKMERQRPDGKWLEVRGMPLPDGGFVSIYIDITERKRAEERIHLMALHDPLTDLPNRLNFNDQVEQALERGTEHGQHFALLFIDLDGFKQVNDSLGHDAGDALLIEVAVQLKAAVRETDVVARLGGDEFVILLHDIQSADITRIIAADIVGRLAAPFQLAAGRAQIGASVGIALYPEHGQNRESLLKAADAAMYAAKAAGRGAWRFATPPG